ncbi:MAG TPA: TlpA disulfide reductase family protein [Ktedonobacterales bacterium]|jgi:thiol-disulfide isomerase/thioredoxin|nr:TlpA disulfide reductase family protein [Ktedonobacterales bacterium]
MGTSSMQRIQAILPRAIPRTGTQALWMGTVLAGLLAVLLAATLRAQANVPSSIGGLAGKSAPGFTLPAERDAELLPQPVSYSPHSGHPTVLVFFFTLCTHCLLETKTLHDLAEAYPGSGLQMLYIDSPGESPKIADMYVKRLGITMPILLDGNGRIAARFGVRYNPTVLFVDGQGVVRTVRIGESSDAQLRADFTALLGKRGK